MNFVFFFFHFSVSFIVIGAGRLWARNVWPFFLFFVDRWNDYYDSYSLMYMSLVRLQQYFSPSQFHSYKYHLRNSSRIFFFYFFTFHFQLSTCAFRQKGARKKQKYVYWNVFCCQSFWWPLTGGGKRFWFFFFFIRYEDKKINVCLY